VRLLGHFDHGVADRRRAPGGKFVLIYILVDSFLVVIWAVTDPDGFFWPIFPIVGWGIGVVMNAWDVYFTEDFSEDAIEREIEHLARKR